MNISSPSVRLGLIASAILGMLAASFSAVSAAAPSSASITVRYADLNIASPAGARTLYERIRTASQSACNYFWFKSDEQETRCVRNTIANAVTQIDQPALSTIFNAKFKISVPSTLVSQSR